MFAERARGYVVKLQGGDEYCRAMWKKVVLITMAQNQIIYDRLSVSLSEKDVMGESLYNQMPELSLKDLTAKGLAVESEGALVVYLDEINKYLAKRWPLSSKNAMVDLSMRQPILPVPDTVLKR